MKISKKCQYALKAAFELAWRKNSEPISAQDIAKAQNVSVRFMEIILNELKRGVYTKGQKRLVTGLVLTPENCVSIGRDRKRAISALIHKFTLGVLDINKMIIFIESFR